MPQKGVHRLSAAIRAKGFDWVGDEAQPLATLSATEQRAYLGLSVSDEELAATAAAIKSQTALSAFRAVAAPAAIDWRNNGGDWTTPIKDQQSCGSCVSFGTCATLESRIKIKCRNASMTPDLSEAHLFYCGCGNCCNTGWGFTNALDFCKNTGVALESAFPYTPGNQPCKAGLTPYSKLSAWTAVLAVADRKNVLATNGPMVAGMAVYQDFFAYRTGVYRHATGALAGYHAICVVGYDDAQQCWICKNSWNTTWGDNGWFRIGYGDSMIDTSFAFYDVDLPCPVPEDDCQKYLAYLTRVLQAARVNRSLRACLRYYVCRRLPRPVCSPANLNVVRAVLAILKRCPKYKVPFCRSLG